VAKWRKCSDGLAVTRRNGSELLELAVDVLDKMALFANLLVMDALDFAASFGRDHRGFACGLERRDDAAVGVVGFVCRQSADLDLRQQLVSTFQIVSLAGAERDGEWIAEGANQGMDFRVQPAFAAPDRPGLFLGAPALC
jgi:hypothetical protein